MENTWGFISNKRLFEFLEEHQNIWDEREKVCREVDPIIRNTIIERRKYELQKENTLDYYNEIMHDRMQVAKREETGWRIDVQRDEGNTEVKLK